MGTKTVHKSADELIGKRVKECAQERGYTAQSLADETGIPDYTIYRIYRGKSVTHEFIKLISEELGVSADYLLNGEDDKGKKIMTREDMLAFFCQLEDAKLSKVYQIARLSLDMAQ